MRRHLGKKIERGVKEETLGARTERKKRRETETGGFEGFEERNRRGEGETLFRTFLAGVI